MNTYINWYRPLEKQKLQQSLQKRFGYHLLLAGNTDLSQVADSPVNHSFAMRENWRIGFKGLVGSFDEMPFESDSIDVIVLAHALEHCQSPASVIKEVNRVLRHDGYLIITGFNPYRAVARNLFSYEARQYDIAGKMLSLSEAKRLINLTGFETVNIKRFGMFASGSKFTRIADAIGLRFLRCFACGYLMVARKQAIKLSPIKVKTAAKARTSVAFN